VVHPRQVPRRRPLQEFVIAVLQELTANVLIRVLNVYVPGSGRVRSFDEGARESRVLDHASNGNILAGLHVCADANRELGIPTHEVSRRHRTIVGCS
jgi:hypothetical protein